MPGQEDGDQDGNTLLVIVLEAWSRAQYVRRGCETSRVADVCTASPPRALHDDARSFPVPHLCVYNLLLSRVRPPRRCGTCVRRRYPRRFRFTACAHVAASLGAPPVRVADSAGATCLATSLVADVPLIREVLGSNFLKHRREIMIPRLLLVVIVLPFP